MHHPALPGSGLPSWLLVSKVPARCLGKCQKLIAASYVYAIPLLDDSILVVNSMPLHRDFFECSTVSQNILGNVLYGIETASVFWWADKQMDVVLHGGSRFVVRNTYSMSLRGKVVGVEAHSTTRFAHVRPASE